MPGGVVRDLSERSLSEIAKRWPKIDGAEVNSAAKTLQIGLQHAPETPARLRAVMDDLVMSAAGLRDQLQTLSEEAYDHLWSDFSETGDQELIQRLPGLLDRLKLAAMRGHNAEVGNDGRSRSGSRHELIVKLARLLDECGYEVDARPKGDLCLLVDIVLEDLDARPANVRATVRDALARMGGGNQLQPGQ